MAFPTKFLADYPPKLKKKELTFSEFPLSFHSSLSPSCCKMRGLHLVFQISIAHSLNTHLSLCGLSEAFIAVSVVVPVVAWFPVKGSPPLSVAVPMVLFVWGFVFYSWFLYPFLVKGSGVCFLIIMHVLISFCCFKSGLLYSWFCTYGYMLNFDFLDRFRFSYKWVVVC